MLIYVLQIFLQPLFLADEFFLYNDDMDGEGPEIFSDDDLQRLSHHDDLNIPSFGTESNPMTPEATPRAATAENKSSNFAGSYFNFN